MSAAKLESAKPGARSTVAAIAPFARLAMGVVFLVAGAAKAWDPIQFFWEIISYAELLGVDRVVWDRIATSGLVIAPLECGVGLALLFNWRPRIIMPVAAVLMAAFTALTIYAWHGNANLNCGCFGSLTERSPGEAAVEDCVMLVLLLVAWRWGTSRLPVPFSKAFRVVAIGTLIPILITGFQFYPEVERLKSSDLKVGMRLRGLSPKGTAIDLMEGDYLVEFFSPSCGHCRNAVPTLNRWSQIPELPPIVGLSVYPEDSSAMRKFKEMTHPNYQIAMISTSDFRRLTIGHGYPRLALVRDGVIEHVWERGNTPSTGQLRQLLGQQEGKKEG